MTNQRTLCRINLEKKRPKVYATMNHHRVSPIRKSKSTYASVTSIAPVASNLRSLLLLTQTHWPFPTATKRPVKSLQVRHALHSLCVTSVNLLIVMRKMILRGSWMTQAKMTTMNSSSLQTHVTASPISSLEFKRQSLSTRPWTTASRTHLRFAAVTLSARVKLDPLH